MKKYLLQQKQSITSCYTVEHKLTYIGIYLKGVIVSFLTRLSLYLSLCTRTNHIELQKLNLIWILLAKQHLCALYRYSETVKENVVTQPAWRRAKQKFEDICEVNITSLIEAHY